MQAVVLRGNQDGYQIVLDQAASFKEIKETLRELLDNLAADSSTTNQISFDVLSNQRLLTAEQNQELEQLFSEYEHFQIHKVIPDVITIEDAIHLKEQDNVHLATQTIRNGQTLELKGDVLYLGLINEGGRLLTTGNIYVMGTVMGILQAGYPSGEDKVVIGDLHQAQQVRIGEQISIVETDQPVESSQTVAYVNDLHVLQYGQLSDLRTINPKIYHQMGG
ncbi:cell division inhibitor [Lactobacillus sp. LC28-10]|uniref:Cell division inhibitor n=1 Tax=Secundilactobacillus angelensis TaxID=2722706 RepID=A0ABX1L2A2_9LACO|nr:septum site-determining protein MinC [Secundilactobacillus angelensis]MCH5462063.1 cell division inhibitor [Secundilactobacillus angelensis]NLR18456.1 cell division inhibitor [Secundilactobacillus angelensis]